MSGAHRLHTYHTAEWALPVRLGAVLRAHRERRSWDYDDVAQQDHSGSLVAILRSVETGRAAHVTFDALTAVCEVLGTTLAQALTSADAAGDAPEDEGRRRVVDEPTQQFLIGQTIRSPLPLGARLADLRLRKGLSLNNVATALGWAPADLQDIEQGRQGVSRAELLGILNILGVTGRGTEPWMWQLPQACSHGDGFPLWTCASCRMTFPIKSTDDPDGPVTR